MEVRLLRNDVALREITGETQSARPSGGHNLMSTALSTEVATTTWNIDPANSAAQFKVRHMMISNVKGELHTSAGTWNWMVRT